jgi:hypothetical protein
MRPFRFKLPVLVASLAISGIVNAAHPLDFLTPEQRVFMMNKFLESQNELTSKSGKAGAADGSGATPLTDEQRIKLLNWFVTGRTGRESEEPIQPKAAAPKSLAVPALASSPATQPVQANPSTGETDLAAVFGKWPTLSRGVKFERFRDGFAIDGTRYLDPEGTITAYGFDEQSGDFTYLTRSAANEFVLKSGRASNQGEPIEIAKAVRRNGMWTVTTATGKKLAGNKLIPLARGFIVARENTGYRYIPGRGLTSFAAPEQFSIASLQSGNVSGTGYILLERNPEEQASPSSNFLGSLKALGSTLGIAKKEDYALLNMDNKKLFPVNVSIEDNQVQVLSMCRRQNIVVAQCERMDSYEALFQPNGMRNMSHYFWRIRWFNAGGRPVLVSQEGGLTKVAATDLESNKKVMLFERAMGIASFDVNQGADGTISVTAQMGFNSEKKDNIVALFDASGVEAKEAN